MEYSSTRLLSFINKFCIFFFFCSPTENVCVGFFFFFGEKVNFLSQAKHNNDYWGILADTNILALSNLPPPTRHHPPPTTHHPIVSCRYIFLVAPGNALIMRHEHLAERPTSISILMNSFAPGFLILFLILLQILPISSVFCRLSLFLFFFPHFHHFFSLFLFYFPVFFANTLPDCSGPVDFLSGLAN